jgi:hypothetical protein
MTDNLKFLMALVADDWMENLNAELAKDEIPLEVTFTEESEREDYCRDYFLISYDHYIYSTGDWQKDWFKNLLEAIAMFLHGHSTKNDKAKCNCPLEDGK